MCNLKKKVSGVVCFLLTVAASILLLSLVQTESKVVYALSSDDVLAEYSFTRLNETNCDVRITNKDSATRAIVPSSTIIDGKEYTVTEVALNGFMSSLKLKRVTLPITLEKIGNTAFANCTALENVFLANVKNIGNNAFMRCTSLAEVMIPKSVSYMGATVFRNCETLVRVRASAPGDNWLSNWNAYNLLENVEYNSSYIEPVVLEPLYEVSHARTATSSNLVGYAVAGGQPYAEEFYNGQNIYVHAYDQDTGLPILQIEQMAYAFNNFDQLIVEYSDIPISIQTNAFFGCDGNSITINRSIDYIDDQNTDGTSENLFTSSTVKTVVLPDTISGLCRAMFYDCLNLQDIHFVTPSNRADPEKIVSELESTRVVTLPSTDLFTFIGESAFA